MRVRKMVSLAQRLNCGSARDGRHDRGTDRCESTFKTAQAGLSAAVEGAFDPGELHFGGRRDNMQGISSTGKGLGCLTR